MTCKTDPNYRSPVYRKFSVWRTNILCTESSWSDVQIFCVQKVLGLTYKYSEYGKFLVWRTNILCSESSWSDVQIFWVRKVLCLMYKYSVYGKFLVWRTNILSTEFFLKRFTPHWGLGFLIHFMYRSATLCTFQFQLVF